MYLLVLEFLGTNELLVILVVALLLLGPRRLPQMSRKLGKSLADFKRASEDFKRTWEREVEMEVADTDARGERSLPTANDSILAPTVGRDSLGPGSTSEDISTADNLTVAHPAMPVPSVTPADPASIQPAPTVSTDAPASVATPTRKRDWL